MDELCKVCGGKHLTGACTERPSLNFDDEYDANDEPGFDTERGRELITIVEYNRERTRPAPRTPEQIEEDSIQERKRLEDMGFEIESVSGVQVLRMKQPRFRGEERGDVVVGDPESTPLNLNPRSMDDLFKRHVVYRGSGEADLERYLNDGVTHISRERIDTDELQQSVVGNTDYIVWIGDSICKSHEYANNGGTSMFGDKMGPGSIAIYRADAFSPIAPDDEKEEDTNHNVYAHVFAMPPRDALVGVILFEDEQS